VNHTYGFASIEEMVLESLLLREKVVKRKKEYDADKAHSLFFGTTYFLSLG
jgi:hypothetical protein